ncbi:unnamed protein product [Calypogeia fissa]
MKLGCGSPVVITPRWPRLASLKAGEGYEIRVRMNTGTTNFRKKELLSDGAFLCTDLTFSIVTCRRGRT